MSARSEPGCFALSIILLVLAVLGGVIAALLMHHGTMPGATIPHASEQAGTVSRASGSPRASATEAPSFLPSMTLPRVYVVRAGDSLYFIAQREYGMPDRWRLIYAANRSRLGPQPNLIYAGERLVIPALPAK